ncbi:hypothetical protein KCG44_12970 [Pacificimonas sp. WHA3]|uniref:Uncharacterized protein n=1 Tax=Pacificimonas pallii TaxID=2827236 RepID=A0ABS6SH02_9SPHN|nr:hypothetical protein [Pacificimonas pallii]MBV7257698.1 hypothetical protein [Pacificimonas pallii]
MSRSPRRPLIAGLSVLIATGFTASAAAEINEAEFISCAAKVDQEERLACYDGMATRLNTEAQQIVADRAAKEKRLAEARAAEAAKLAAEQAAAEAARQAALAAAEAQAVEAAFGAEDLKAGDGRVARGIDDISSTLAQMIPGNSFVGSTFVLANGQAWRQKGGRPFKAKPGAEITVKRAALSGYELRVSGRKRAVRVDRVN